MSKNIIAALALSLVAAAFGAGCAPAGATQMGPRYPDATKLVVAEGRLDGTSSAQYRGDPQAESSALAAAPVPNGPALLPAPFHKTSARAF